MPRLSQDISSSMRWPAALPSAALCQHRWPSAQWGTSTHPPHMSVRGIVMLGFVSAALVALALAAPPAKPVDGNRLAYLDELNPWYPHRDFPKLVTPQWV